MKTSLFVRIPREFRGKPRRFISHTWLSDLGGPHSCIGMIGRGKDDYVWLDWACYNQHGVHSRHIARDMKKLVGHIGEVSCALTTEPFFSRSWCVWEIVSAHRTRANVRVHHQVDRIRRKYYGTEQEFIPPKFDSVANLVASLPDDRMMISEAIQKEFGSVEKADAFIRSVLPEI